MNEKDNAYIVPFERKLVKEYLDNCIINWRDQLDKSKNDKEKLIAECYCDAFQCMRISIFGETLSEDIKYLKENK